MPAAEQIIHEETSRFFVDANHRVAAPVISSLRRGLLKPKQAELERLFAKLPDLDQHSRKEIEQFADRLVNKMLHPPLESLRGCEFLPFPVFPKIFPGAKLSG